MSRRKLHKPRPLHFSTPKGPGLDRVKKVAAKPVRVKKKVRKTVIALQLAHAMSDPFRYRGA